MKILPRPICENEWGAMEETVICAGDMGDAAACKGDSGGALICKGMS